MVLDSIPWDNLYPENTREIATYRKQIRIPPRPAWPEVTNTQQWHDGSIPRYNLYQERKREITLTETNQNATAARLYYCWIDSIGDKYLLF